MSLTERYSGKRILITGTTGFLGKVLLQKFLYSLSHVDKIYVLIRAKKGSDLSERFKKQIVSSPCFDRIRNIHQNRFDQFMETKVQPIQGDLQKQRVGLSEKDFNEIVNRCHIIINCAASIDFNARLDQAIDSNIKGSLRMMDLAKQVKNLEIFTHISTCYVNCNLKGLIKEEIYEKNIDAQNQFQAIDKLSLNELVSQTDKILGEYPNTYTYTKGLCERLMKSRKGDLPLCIVRPAIINTSYNEPFPGWLDSIAAAAALFLFVGLGIIKEVQGNPNKIGDTVPVDLVVANIIVATAYNFKNTKLPIYHVGTSDRNPITWGQCKEAVTEFWNSNVSQSKVSRSHVYLTENKINIQFQRIRRRLPIWLYSKVAPVMGKQHIKNSEKMVKTIARGDQIQRIFKFFIQNQWIYECRNVKHLSDFLTAEEKKTYLIDSADLDIKYFLRINNYGLQKYILKENIEMPTPQNSNLLGVREKGSYFSDIKWAYSTDLSFNNKSNNKQFKTKILSSNKVLQAIDQQSLKRIEGTSIKLEDMKKKVRVEAIKIITDIVGEIRLPVVRFMAWTLHKIFKNIYQKVNINMQMFATIRQIEQGMNIPIVLVPTHKSYIDFLIVSYIFFVYNLKLPYIVSDQALMNANLLPFLIKSSGAFFYKKKEYHNSTLYRIIFNKYIELLLREGNNLQFFIEGTRTRTGKILTPQSEILNILLDTVIHGKLNDVCLVPLTINYEKVLEGDTFPNELLGEQKVEQSLLRIVKAIPLLKVNFGRVYVEICNPIFMKQFTEDLKKRPNIEKVNRKIIVEELGKQIICRLTQKLVIMSTGIVSAVLLMHRKGISEDHLIKTVNWISKYILKKGYKIGGLNENSSTIAVRNAIGYLSEITTKTKKNIFQLQISAGDQFQKLLMLSYYRNTIMHAFLPQAFIGCVVASFGNQLNSKEGVKLTRVYQQTLFLMNLLREEYHISYNLENQQQFRNAIEKMQQNLILMQKEDDKIVIHASADKMIAFHCSLLRSLIECYWACLVYIITISKNEGHRHQVASLEKFFDMVQWFMQSLYDEKVIEHYEACSLQSIKNAFQTYQKQGIIKITKGDRKKDSVVEVTVKIETLEGIESNLKFFIKSMYHNSVLSPMDVAKSSLIGANLSKI